MSPNARDRIPLGDTVDVRPRPEFRVGHFASAISCPLDELDDRRHFLPRAGRRFHVYGAPEEVKEAIALLEARGYRGLRPHPAAGAFASPDAPVESPWVSGPVRARLWEPTPFLAEILDRPDGPRPGLAVDVACGSGRDTTWLALSGFRPVGVDLLRDALERAVQLWRETREAAGTHASSAGAPLPSIEPPRWVETNLERAWPLREARFDLIVCVRFLWRPLLPRFARALRPGGHLIYETFTREQARYGKPKRPEYLLVQNELRQRFEREGLRTRLYREAAAPGGPALASLWAERPA